MALLTLPLATHARDLPGVLEAGVLRHLGIPYANFVTGSGDGLDIELMQGFAAHLGVKYRFVKSDWSRIFGDLTGRHARRGENGAELLDSAPITGDVIANGMTLLPWRQDVINFFRSNFSIFCLVNRQSRIKSKTNQAIRFT